MEKQAATAREAPQKINLLQRQLLKIESEIGKSDKDSSNIQQLILNLVASYCLKNNLMLQEFPKSIIYQEKDILIETNHFVVEGDFIKLLLLVNHMEHHKEIGKIVSTHFQSRKNFRTKRVELSVVIYIQNLKKISA